MFVANDVVAVEKMGLVSHARKNFKARVCQRHSDA